MDKSSSIITPLTVSQDELIRLGFQEETNVHARAVQLPVHPDVDQKRYTHVLEHLTKRACEDHLQSTTLANEMFAHRQREREALQKLFGADGLERLKTFHREFNDKQVRMDLNLQSVGGETASKERTAFQDHRLAEHQKLMKQLGVDREDFARIDAELAEIFRNIGAEKDGAHKEAEVHLNDDVPKDVSAFKSGGEPSKWRVRNAPYANSWSSSSHLPPGGFTIETNTNSANFINGQIKNQISVYDIGASDFDSVWIEQKGRVGFWYFPFFNSGRPEIWIKGISLGTFQEFRATDEPGFSSFYTDQRLWFALSATNGEQEAETRFVISELELQQHANESFLFAPINRMDHRPLYVYWYRVELAERFRTHVPVWIEFGFDCRLKTRTNDYSIYAAIRSHFHLVGAAVRLLD